MVRLKSPINLSYVCLSIVCLSVCMNAFVCVQHAVAAGTLVDLGGVEFLSQLHLHCDVALHPLVDESLEHLLQFSNSPNPPSATSIPHGTSLSTAASIGASHSSIPVLGKV